MYTDFMGSYFVTNMAMALMVASTIHSAPLAKVGSSCAPLLTKSLVYGNSGSDVVSLQSFLIAQGDDIPAGPTGYFGDQTKAAVNDFQLKYSSQILLPLGLSAPTGAVYSATLAEINAIYCTW